jgi:hypothetical protein
MGLTSGALALLLALIAATTLAGVLLGWRRLSRPGARRVAARAAALCLLEAAVLSLVLVVANRYLLFYSSWSDLFGSDHASAAVRAAPAGRSGTAGMVRVLTESAVPVPGVPGSVGRLAAVWIHGQLSGLTVPGQLYLPPGSGPAPGSARAAGPAPPYPVIVALTSQPAAGASPYAARNLAAAVAAQIAAGRLEPVILLVLSAGPGPAGQPGRRWPGGPGCLNVPGGAQGQTFLDQDVPRVLQAQYHAAAARWAVLGDSAGGYCSLELALSDSAAFAVAAVPHGRYGPPPAAQAGGSPQIQAQENLLWQLRNQPAQPVSVLFAGPGTGAGLGPAARFAALARPPMRVRSAGLADGPSPLAPVLDWIGAALRPAALAPREEAEPPGQG